MDKQTHKHDGEEDETIKKKRRVVDADGNDISESMRCCGGWRTARQAFIIKTYLITAIMLSITATCVTVATLVPGARKILKKYDWLIYVGGVCGFVLMIVIIVGKKWSRKTPNNYFLLFAFTICWSLMVTMMTTYFNAKYVMIAMVTTAFMTVGLTAIASGISGEINWCWGITGALISTIAPFLFFAFFLRDLLVQNIICFLGTIVTSVYIVIDSKNIMKRLELNEYIIGALMLYCDIIQLFLFILSLMGKK